MTSSQPLTREKLAKLETRNATGSDKSSIHSGTMRKPQTPEIRVGGPISEKLYDLSRYTRFEIKTKTTSAKIKHSILDSISTFSIEQNR